jgi:hypothetical protein
MVMALLVCFYHSMAALRTIRSFSDFLNHGESASVVKLVDSLAWGKAHGHGALPE